MKNAEIAAYEHTLQLEWRGDNRINAEGTDCYHIYNWPREANGSEHDRTLLIHEFPDGGVSIYLYADALGFRERLLQLRKMANVPR